MATYNFVKNISRDTKNNIGKPGLREILIEHEYN